MATRKTAKGKNSRKNVHEPIAEGRFRRRKLKTAPVVKPPTRLPRQPVVKPPTRLPRQPVVKPPTRLPRQPKLSARKTRKPNGLAGAPIVPEQPEDLGPLQLPTPEASQAVLRDLAKRHDTYVQADKAYKELAEKTKAAKTTRDELLKEIIREIRVQTHESALPLLQLADREDDQAEMEAAAADPIVEQ